MDREGQFWRKALEATPECVPADKPAGEWTEAEQRHVAACARCQTEQELFRDFVDAPPHASDAGAVTWIASELRRRQRPEAPRSPWAQGWRWLSGPWRFGAALAGLAAVALVSWQLGNRNVAAPAGGVEVFRGGELVAEGPRGDLEAAPVELRWSGAGAARYRIEILQVDGEVLWSGEGAASPLPLPPEARAKAAPGKTLLWRVRALDRAGRVVAESPSTRFRVRPKSLPPGE